MAERDGWKLRIKEAKTRAELLALDAQLAEIGARLLAAGEENWARAERFWIGLRLTKLKASVQPVSPGATHAFAANYGLPVPDGRWLYAYRLGSDAFDRLQCDLARMTPTGLEQSYTPGLFVLWASEWFRRCYRGNGHRWRDLAGALGIVEDQALFRRLTAAGLRYWGRDLQRSGGDTEYLGSLAREGGFPAMAVRDGGSGWAGATLAAIIAPLLAKPESDADSEFARTLAQGQLHRVPQLFRDDDFVDLCADLACAIVALRREADGPAAAAGLPTVAWLELNAPGWQERLPLNTSDRAAEAMLERLMRVEPLQGAAVSVARFLERTAAGWREAAALSVDGMLAGDGTDRLDAAYGRLRAFAAGELARHVPGELAMLEAPGDGEKYWTARSTRSGRGRHAVPFGTTIELDLRSGDQRVARIALAGGKPRRGLLIVTTVEEGDADAPSLLRVVGSGSGHYRAPVVVVQAPSDWIALAVGDESATSLGAGAGETQLWLVAGGAFFTDPTGDRFRILCGQADDEHNRIELFGDRIHWAETSGDIDLYRGPPTSRSGSSDLYLRAIGARTWTRAPKQLPIGHYELGWRRDDVLLDRRRIAVVPADCDLRRSGPINQRRYDLIGFGKCQLVPDDTAPVRMIDAGAWVQRLTSRPAHWFGARLCWPDGPDLRVRINHPTAAAIARWSGEHLPANAHFTLFDLPDLVAVSEGRMRLTAELNERGRKIAEMLWEFDGELPMSSIAADLASLLLPASIDAELRLEMLDGLGAQWRVRQFPHELQIEQGAAVVPRGLAVEGAVLAGRALARPEQERNFGAYSLLTDSNHRPAPLPPLDGSWLIYVRSGEQVLTRPRFLTGADAPVAEHAVGRAMLLPQGSELTMALDALLAAAEQDDAAGAAIIVDLITLVDSLQGLPPLTFHIFERVVQRHGVLTRMALSATAAQRGAVMALSDALPFAWCGIAREHWQSAQGATFGRLLEQLEVLGAEAPRYAKDALDEAVRQIVEREPLLTSILQPGVSQPMTDIAQSFLNRAIDRIPPAHGSRYRKHLEAQLPGYFLRLPDQALETLDAPCAAAAAAAGLWQPDTGDIRHIKTVARNFPTYFAEAFAAAYQEFA